MKLLHLFKGSLQNITNMQMHNSSRIASVTALKKKWLKLWHEIRDLVKVLFRIFLLKKLSKFQKF